MSDFQLSRGRQYNRLFDFDAPAPALERPASSPSRLLCATLSEAEALAIARELLAKHGFAGLPIKLTNAARRLGCAVFYAGQPVRMELSRKMIRHNHRPEVLDTILHEIAHFIAGPEAGHGPRWQAAAIRVGAKPIQYAAVSTMPPAPVAICCGLCHDVLARRHRTPAAKWLGARLCRQCGLKSRGTLYTKREG